MTEPRPPLTADVLTHPVGGQVDAALPALPEDVRQTVRVAEDQLHVVLTHQHAADTNTHVSQPDAVLHGSISGVTNKSIPAPPPRLHFRLNYVTERAVMKKAKKHFEGLILMLIFSH